MRRIKQAIKSLLLRSGYQISKLDPDYFKYKGISHNPDSRLPAGAAEYLRPDNPALLELRSKNAAFDCPANARGLWKDDFIQSQILLQQFRGDNAYVWQYRDARVAAELKSVLVERHLRSIDPAGLLDLLEEDGLFGCHYFDLASGKRISRDLLDSVNEILFLESELQLASRPDLKIVDIGAGYGRLAHRMLAALPNISRYLCTDAIPESTFVCDYYLKFRDVGERAQVVDLPGFESALAATSFDVAINIHSFSEMPLRAITWWVQQVAANRIPYFFIIPNNSEHLRSTEEDGVQQSFDHVLEQAGYRLLKARPKHTNPDVQRLASHERYQYFLYELKQ